MTAWKGISGIVSTVVPIILIIAVIIVALKFQTDIGNFITKVTRSKDEIEADKRKATEEKRVQENGLFDNIAEFFFGLPEQAKPTSTSDVGKNDFDQNTQTQKNTASRTQRGNDQNLQNSLEQQIAVDTRTQATRDKQLADLIAQANVNLNKTTVTVVKPKSTAVIVKPKSVKKPASSFSSSAGGLVASLISSKSGSGGGSSVVVTSKSGSKTGTSFKGSSVGVSDKITARVIKNTTPAPQGKGNLSKQSQTLNKKTPSRISRGK